jgi:hypothetical protein
MRLKYLIPFRSASSGSHMFLQRMLAMIWPVTRPPLQPTTGFNALHLATSKPSNCKSANIIPKNVD